MRKFTRAEMLITWLVWAPGLLVLMSQMGVLAALPALESAVRAMRDPHMIVQLAWMGWLLYRLDQFGPYTDTTSRTS